MDTVTTLAERLSGLGWVTDPWVGGSLATGDHVPGVSDLDLVAVVAGTVTKARLSPLTALHLELDEGAAADAKLGCVYVDEARAARRPHYWMDPVIAGLGLTSMARGRHALATGELLTKSAAIDRAAASAWLVDHLLKLSRWASRPTTSRVAGRRARGLPTGTERAG